METVIIDGIHVSHNNRYEKIKYTSELLQWGCYLIEMKTGNDSCLAVLKEYLNSKGTYEFDVRYCRKKNEDGLWNKVNNTLYITTAHLNKVIIYDLKKKIVIPSLYELSKEKISSEIISELRRKGYIPDEETISSLTMSELHKMYREQFGIVEGGKMKSRKYKYKRRKSISSRKSRSKSLHRSVH